ncbi:isoprenyl transferase [Pediococcus stilesii]|uniref:Isoprenyl transferase n=1 Tax=Pediococcus stilesii TaxID=331679 RepID=A0A0R2L096_9LACO|nr:isoprenyl transferase [Pediococcus stilesii]KRN95209.1 undecaprenyl pyrophosphate synthetase [Pediococcus stilesii]
MKITQKVQTELNDNIPKHVAIIMDGNGRWAQKKFLPRVAGHKRGMEVVKTITKSASKLGIKVLTLYAFSTENWKRPQDEVSFLMKLPITFFDKFVPELVEEGIQVRVTGNIAGLPAATQQSVQKAIADTANGTKMILNFALNYGSRDEITQMVQAIATDIAHKKLTIDEIDEKVIDQHLQTNFLGELSDPDVLIRTSGEERISNFLLWQIAYSELVFTDTLWPDFNEQIFIELIKEYQKRDRRFGAIKK